MVEAINELLENYANNIKNKEDLEFYKRGLCKKYTLSGILNSDILKQYQATLRAGAQPRLALEQVLRKRTVRTMSGIAPVAVLTKSYPCPGTCAYCPHEADVPVSYLSNEPAVMRAIRCGYDPYKQVIARLKALENNGHKPTKIEIIVIGGTWSFLPTNYKYWYILNCFAAANNYKRYRDKSFSQQESSATFLRRLKAPYKQNLKLSVLQAALLKEQIKNESAEYNIIGLTLETRPDYINEQELVEMRRLGCTRVEIGVQAIDDQILQLNQRGHGVAEIAAATASLRRYGFKITYHLMPALPGATPAKDLKLFKQLFSDERFQPDQIKFYPTVVTKGSLLYRWYLQGKYRPYSDKSLQELIVKCKESVPRYVRIIRLIRDIPGESIIAGNKITNLRQIMKDRGVKCNCIRCREAQDQALKLKQVKLQTIDYAAAAGREYFISFDSLDDQTLFGFCRLRIDQTSPVSPALIRELHVYGELVAIGAGQKVQHSGLGRRLLAAAEHLAKQQSCPTLAIISGVGVRGYYRKFGYRLKDSYMVKKL
jgi:elongator complex protein 3